MFKCTHSSGCLLQKDPLRDFEKHGYFLQHTHSSFLSYVILGHPSAGGITKLRRSTSCAKCKFRIAHYIKKMPLDENLPLISVMERRKHCEKLILFSETCQGVTGM